MKLIKNIILTFIALILFIVIFIISFFIEIIMTVIEKSFDNWKDFFNACYDGANYLFYQIAVAIDKSGGVVGKRLWNWIFIKPNARIKFGEKNEKGEYYTMSFIMGSAYIDEDMEKFGFWFKEFLDLFEYEHILKTQDNNVQ